MLFAKFRRIDLALNVRETAALAGITQPEVTLIENGRLRPNARQLEGLARALKVAAPEVLLQPVAIVPNQAAALEAVTA